MHRFLNWAAHGLIAYSYLALIFAIVAAVCLCAPASAQTYVLHPGVNGIIGEDGVYVDVPLPSTVPLSVRIRAMSGQAWSAGVENVTDQTCPYQGSGSMVELWQHVGVDGMAGVIAIPGWGGGYFGGAPLAPFDQVLDFDGPSARTWDATYWRFSSADSLGDPALWTVNNSPVPGHHRIFLRPSMSTSMEQTSLAWYARGVWHLPRVAITYH